VSDSIDGLRALAAAPVHAPPAMDAYVAKVHNGAFTITDGDVEDLKRAGITEDEIFEQTVAAAIAEGLRRLDRADEVIG